jgi:hypothetical protein
MTYCNKYFMLNSISFYASMSNGKEGQFLARQHAGTLILHAIHSCGRVYQRGKAGTVFSGGGASKPHRSKYILVASAIFSPYRMSLYASLDRAYLLNPRSLPWDSTGCIRAPLPLGGIAHKSTRHTALLGSNRYYLPG